MRSSGDSSSSDVVVVSNETFEELVQLETLRPPLPPTFYMRIETLWSVVGGPTSVTKRKKKKGQDVGNGIRSIPNHKHTNCFQG